MSKHYMASASSKVPTAYMYDRMSGVSVSNSNWYCNLQVYLLRFLKTLKFYMYISTMK